MNRLKLKQVNLAIRKNRVRTSVSGTAERPRLSVHISNRHVSAQIINDVTGTTLAAYSTVNNKKATGTLSDKAELVGEQLAKLATKAKISKVAFDRNGRLYQKRLSAFAEAARKNGLEF